MSGKNLPTRGRIAIQRLMACLVLGGTAAGLWTAPHGALAIAVRIIFSTVAGGGILYLAWLQAAESVASRGRITVEDENDNKGPR